MIEEYFEEPEQVLRVSHRRDDQEIMHQEFKETEQNVPGIYMMITPQWRG